MVAEHPIQGLMKTAMESIKDMVDVNTVVGDPVETPDGSVIIPVSRVSLGFAAGGGEYEARAAAGTQGGEGGAALPFGGGSGAGVSVQPVAFVVVGGGQVRLLPVDSRALYDRLIDLAPEILERLESLMSGREGYKGTRGGEEEEENRPARPRHRGNDHEPPPEYNPQGRR